MTEKNNPGVWPCLMYDDAGYGSRNVAISDPQGHVRPFGTYDGNQAQEGIRGDMG